MSPNVVCNTCIFHSLYESVMVRILQGVSPSIWDHNFSYGPKWTATCSGPTREESVAAASGLAELLARLEKEFWCVLPPLASDPNDWQWHPSMAGDEWPPGKIAHAVGEAVLVDIGL